MKNKRRSIWDQIIYLLYGWAGEQLREEEKDMVLTLAREDSHEAVERALLLLERLIEQNKATNKRSRDVLVRARALATMTEH